MRKKGLHNKFLAGLLAFSVVVSGSGIYSMVNGINAAAADDDEDPGEELTKVLGPEDLDGLRMKWNDTSNITEGEEREVELSDGTTITVKDNGTMRKDKSSQWLAENEMGMGINLGNTLEAVQIVENKSKITNRTQYDTAWSNPVTTREYIDKIHRYVINTLRIPVAWSNGDLDDGKYEIQGALLDRVEEVANYALDNGMYVVINEHWDNGWWGQFGACKYAEDGKTVIIDEETRDAAWERYERYWEQISERFKDYSDHLIFEGANEELCESLISAICINGPAKGYTKPTNATDDIETISGEMEEDEIYDTVNKINQKFVDVVRGTGGNNASRHLLIPGYDTNIQDTADERFEMPTDKENGTSKMFLSVHYYTPGGFCLDNASGIYTTKDQELHSTYLADLKKFSDAGYGIIVGECGVVKPSFVSSSVTQWFYDTFTEFQKYNAVPVLWDNGGYFDRVGKDAGDGKPILRFRDIANFFNTVNGAEGSVDTDIDAGGVVREDGGDIELPDYLDSELWKTPGIHAFLLFQTSDWSYRNKYLPLSRYNGDREESWAYIKGAGGEISADKTIVTDVQLTKNGQYTVSIDGISMSGNSFQLLGVCTDINKNIYKNVTVTDATIKIDGEDVKGEPVDLVVKSDNTYYSFLAINTWESDKKVIYPLADDKVKPGRESIEITFTINGLDQVLEDIESGEYVNPETGHKLNPDLETEPPAPTEEATPSPDGGETTAPDGGANPTATPPAVTTPVLEQGATFNSGNYKYKVTKAAADAKKGTVSLVGLTGKGKSAKKLTVPATITGEDGNAYTINTLGKKAFSGAKATSITLNKKIKVIPDSAFAKCAKLNSVTFKVKLTKVAKNSFKGCKKKIKVNGTAKAANKKLLKKKTSYKKFK